MESKLFTPVTFGPLTLRNRTIRSAAFESMCPGNAPSDMLLDYHRSVAAGGIGMTTVAYAAVTQSGLSFDRQLWMRPEIIPGLRKLTDAIHAEGAAAGIQLGHCGNMSHKSICGCTPVGASSGFNLYSPTFVRGLRAGELPEMARAYGKAVNLAREAGFDAVPVEMNLSSRESILDLIAVARKHGEISMLVNAAGVSPSQASIETILKVDLYGTAVLLEEVGKVIKEDGVGVTISSQSGHRMPALTIEEDMLLATTPTEELLSLDMLQPDSIEDTLHAYQMAKRCNVKRVMAEAVKWGERGARINSISPGIIVTPLAIDEFNGPRGDFYKNMFAKCPAGRPGTADEVANVAELLMSDRGAFITGADFLIDGGATASYFYGPLKP